MGAKQALVDSTDEEDGFRQADVISNGSGSSTDGEDVDECGSCGGGDAGMRATFRVMELRRLRRIRSGRVEKDGLGAHLNSVMKAFILFLLLAKVFNLTTERLHIRHFVIIPLVLTVALIVPAIAQTVYHPEHTFTLWVSTELYTFCLWVSWWFDPVSVSTSRSDHVCVDVSGGLQPDLLCFNQAQIGAAIALLVVLSLTVALFIPKRVLLPCAIKFNLFSARALAWWRDLRRCKDDENDDVEDGNTFRRWRFTYKPSGLLSCAKEEFLYSGEVDEHSRPHGQGKWLDTSFHGECLRGEWVHGKPAGTWFSRESGTGAQFLQCAVGYATSRADCQENDLKSSKFWPRKDNSVRYGIAHVEVPFANGFFPFLPRVEPEYHTATTAEEMIEGLVRGYTKRQASDPSLRLEVVPEADLQTLQERHGMSQVPAYLEKGEHVVYVADSLPANAMDSGGASLEAFVFIHGFNCDLATALARPAQTFSLGGMPPHIVPFVFSYAGGAEFSYFHARARFPDYGDDLAGFLQHLGRHFREVHICTHSCGAEFFLTNWNSISSCFTETVAPSSKTVRKAGPDQEDRRLHLATLTMLNPDVLQETVMELLPDIMKRAEHFTAYNDSNDNALFYSSFVRRLLSGVTGEGCAQHNLFGRCVEPLWVRLRELDGSAMLQRPEPEGNEEERQYTRHPSLRGLVRQNSPNDLHGFSHHQVPGDGSIDIIDCSNIDQNVHSLRHNYFMLNTQMVEDLCQLVGQRQKAPLRTRLSHSHGNVFSFLSPPSFLKSA